MLEKNLQYIEKYNSDLAESIRNHQVLGNFNFAQAESGDIYLIYENVPFHSEKDPQDEAIRVYNNLNDTTKSSINIVFGLGLGYLFKRVYLSSKGRIVVFEPNLDILRITFEHVDFTNELADNRVMIVHKKENLNDAFKKYYLYEDPVNMCFLDIYRMLFPDMIEMLHSELIFLKGVYNNNYYTLFEASSEWVKMGIQNLHNILNSQYIDVLKGKFKDKPAIVISPGPSLSKNIEQVKQYADKAVVFAVGSAIRTVKEKHGIKPDFCVFVDVHHFLEKQLDGVHNVDELNFIMQPTTYKALYEKPSRRNFVYLPRNDAFSEWIASKLKLNIQHYMNKGTVAIAAVYSAINFGCNPIILVGQDLAYDDEGNVYADKTLYNPHANRQELMVAGWHGGMVRTNTSYAFFRRYYEEVAQEFGKRVKLINATEGGAYIEGIDHIPFREAAGQISDTTIDVESIIIQAEKAEKDPLKAGKLSILNGLKENLNALDKLLSTAKSLKEMKNKISIELNKTHINRSYILKLFQELYANNGKMDRIINESCQLISPFIQQENYAFHQQYGRSPDLSSVDEIYNYLKLCDDYYNVIIEQAPILKTELENALKVKKS